MNNNELTEADETLRRLLVMALDAPDRSDDEIESILNSAEPAWMLGDEQTRRIAGKMNRLLETVPESNSGDSGARNSDDVKSQSDQRPRLVSVSTTEVTQRPVRSGAVAALVASMLALVSVVVLLPGTQSTRRISENDQRSNTLTTAIREAWAKHLVQMAPGYRITAKPLPDASPVMKIAVGDEIATSERERRRVTLPDGSVLYVNGGSLVKIATERRVEVARGQVFVEVVPAFGEDQVRSPFEVVTPGRTVTALGTKFSVSVQDSETHVMVTQGRVSVSGVSETVSAGQRLKTGQLKVAELLKSASDYRPTSASRASAELEWTRELMSAATGPLVPKSEYSGGALVTVDPNGQSSRLSLRKYHIDVHIEDGFARTTIDQTYFNHTHGRLEGTFHFPLPTDASLSRLAMYVNGKLMEGGMAERQHARNTFEQIVHKMQDPALLEWVDGSTFKMRVFPLEPRQEKRIVLSYSQRLDSLDGQLHYRFPAGHTMDVVREWSAHLRVKSGAGTEWHSQSHALTAKDDAGDLVLDAALKNGLMDRDLVVRVADTVPSPAGKGEKVAERPESQNPLTLTLSPETRERGQSHDIAGNQGVAFSSVTQENQQYLMLRMRPDLQGEMQRKPHHWVFLYEHAGDRNPLLARAQIEIIRTLLENAEHSDTFSIVTASGRSTLYSKQALLCSPENVAAAAEHLASVHLVGALDLAAAFKKCVEAIHEPDAAANVPSPPGQGEKVADRPDEGGRTQIIVHVGSGMPALGERDAAKLAAMIPSEVPYVGIGVGRRWNQAMMKQAASRTGGLSTQINPDEEIAWRAFDVFSKLHSPRLVNVVVTAKTAGAPAAALPVPSPPDQGEKVAESPDEGDAGDDSFSKGNVITESQSPLTLTLSPETGERGQPGAPFLLFSDLIFQGEEIAAICRIPDSQSLPDSVTVTAELNGQPWTRTIAVSNVRDQATYLPRHWAKLEIDRLLADNAQQHQETIVALSKSMYVMSPFTSLLVLENEEMYTQYNIDRGRKDHWALYPCPEQIELVVEDFPVSPLMESLGGSGPKTQSDVISTIQRLQRPQWLLMPATDFITYDGRNLTRESYYWGAYDRSTRFGTQPLNLWHENGPQDAAATWSFHGSYFNSFERATLDDGLLFGDRSVEATRNDFDSIPVDEFTFSTTPLQQLSMPEFEVRQRLAREPEVDFTLRLTKDRQLSSELADLSNLYYRANSMGQRFRRLEMSGWSRPQLSWNDGAWYFGATENAPVTAARMDWIVDKTAIDDYGTLVPQFGDAADPLSLVVLDDRIYADGYFDVDRLRPESRHFLKLRAGGRFAVPEYKVEMAPTIPLRTHRWSAESISSNAELVTLPTFQLPAVVPFGNNPFHFGDLMAHAPGLNTSAADVMAIVEAETTSRIANTATVPSPPKSGEKVADRPDEGGQQQGRIAAAARALIEKARARGWESVTLPGSDGEAGITIHYDGHGRHVWERVVSEGLREHVVCDGSTQWHVYQEIGLAAKRPFSRFHHRDFMNIVPWLLPTAEELARGADLVAVDDQTIAIVPNASRIVPSPPTSGEKVADRPDEGAALNQIVLHLVFAADGRLTERRIVEQSSGKVLRRITYDADGTIKVLGVDGKELAAMNLHRSTSAPPQLVPELDGLVVLPMPVRTPEVIIEKAKGLDGSEIPDSELSEDFALSLMLSYTGTGNGARVVEIARKRFIEKGDTRDGLYVLLSRFPNALVQAAIPADPNAGTNQAAQGSPEFDLRPSVEGSPLKQFVRQYINWLRDTSAWQPGSSGISEFLIDAPEGSFLQRLAAARNLYVQWSTNEATTDRTNAQVQQEVQRALEFIATCRTLDMGWTLMSAMRPRLNTPELLSAYSKAAERFEQHPRIGLLVRRERIIALFAAGQHDEGRRLFEEWLNVQLNQGFVPPIGQELYNACISDNGLAAMNTLLLDNARRLIDAQLLMTLHSLTVQIRELGNIEIADQMITMLLASLDAEKRPDVSLHAIEQLRRMNDPRANSLLDRVMELPMAMQLPGIWRFASKLAEESNHKRLAVERLQMAIQLEFASRPSVINIETVRSDYAALLAKYDELITAALTLEVPPSEDLSSRIIQAADQWRTLDDDDTAACQTASRLLAKLQQTELAWDYLTTPLAENSGESAPWIALARSLRDEKQTNLSIMAWNRAFEFESTNPEILLEHARMLQAEGLSSSAVNLLEQVRSSEWQPRFNRSKEEAQSLLNAM